MTQPTGGTDGGGATGRAAAGGGASAAGSAGWASVAEGSQYSANSKSGNWLSVTEGSIYAVGSMFSQGDFGMFDGFDYFRCECGLLPVYITSEPPAGDYENPQNLCTASSFRWCLAKFPHTASTVAEYPPASGGGRG